MKKLSFSVILLIFSVLIFGQKFTPKQQVLNNGQHPTSSVKNCKSIYSNPLRHDHYANKESSELLGDEAPKTGATVNIILTNIHIVNMRWYTIECYGKDESDNTYQVWLQTVKDGVLEGEWTKENFSLNNIGIKVNSNTMIPVKEASITFTPLFGSYQIQAMLRDSNQNTYNITYMPIQPHDTVFVKFDHEATVFEIDSNKDYGETDDDAFVTLKLENSDENYFVHVNTVSSYGKEFDLQSEFYSTYIKTPDSVTVLQSPSLRIETQEGATRIQDTTFVYIGFVGTDSIYYDITIFDAFPIPEDTITINIDSMKITDLHETYGCYTFSSAKDDAVFDFSLTTSFIVGKFTEKNFDRVAKSQLIINKIPYPIYAATIEIELSDGKIVFMGDIVARNKTCYRLMMSTPIVDTTKLECTDNQIIDASYVLREIDLSSKSSVMVNNAQKTLSFAASFDRTEELTPANLAFANTDVTDYSFKLHDKNDTTEYDLWEMNCNLHVDDERHLTATVNILTSEKKYYTLTITDNFSVFTVQGDADDEDYIRTFTEQDSIFINMDNIYTDQYAVLSLANDSELVALEFYPNDLDADIFLPAGIYQVEPTGGINTIATSQMVDEDGIPYTSCVIRVDEASRVKKYFCLARGTVTIAKTSDGKMDLTVDAYNSNKRKVQIRYTGKIGMVTGVEEVLMTLEKMPSNEVKKVLYNGRVYILRNGQMFDMMGNRIK